MRRELYVIIHNYRKGFKEFVEFAKALGALTMRVCDSLTIWIYLLIKVDSNTWGPHRLIHLSFAAEEALPSSLPGDDRGSALGALLVSPPHCDEYFINASTALWKSEAEIQKSNVSLLYKYLKQCAAVWVDGWKDARCQSKGKDNTVLGSCAAERHCRVRLSSDVSTQPSLHYKNCYVSSYSTDISSCMSFLLVK